MVESNFAPGIKDREEYGNLSKLRPGQLLDFVVQHHLATRRGPHYDFRLGDKEKGMFSWAMPNNLPAEEKDRQWIARTHLHDYDYNKFEGDIPEGKYGAGHVSKADEGKALITNKTDKTISFSRADKKHPERYTLLQPYEDSRAWQIFKQETPSSSGAEKQHYKSIPKDKIRDYLTSLPKGSEVQAKIDGALQFLNLMNGKAEMLSHRTSKTTGKPVVQTERFFGLIPHLKLPKELRDSVLSTEVYGNHDNKTIPVQELSGLLNSSVAKSLQTQKDKAINLKGILFDIAKLKGENTSHIPYDQRKELLKTFLSYLPKNKFELPESVHTPKDAHRLLDRIEAGKHPKTQEGIVIHKPHGTPAKYKMMPESDVFIRGFFDAEKGSKYEGKGVGGFTYSHEPKGSVVGRVGTGLTDETRKLFYGDPSSFIGRIAKIHSHGKYDKTTAHRVPAFLGLHEG